MGQMYIEEAFKRLNLLEDDYSYSEDQQLKLLDTFVSDDIDDIPEEEIIDVNAESCDDLQDNYVGKIIVECDCCHTRLYKEPEDLIVGSSEDGVELFNLDEECPVCHTKSGYRVIGKIEQYSDNKIENDIEATEEDAEVPSENEDHDEFEDEIHEALKEALNPEKSVALLNKNEFDETGDAEAIAAKIESDYIPGNGELETLDVECSVQGDNIMFTGPKLDIDELYNRMFPEGITPDYVESLEESTDTIEFNSREEAEKYFDDHKEELKDYNSFEDWFDSDVEKLNEELESVEVITDEGNVKVNKDDDKLIVDLSSDDVEDDNFGELDEPTELDEDPGEMIAPLTDEEEDDILATAETNAELAAEEEAEEDNPDAEEFDDIDLEDEDLPDIDEVEEAEIEEEELPEEGAEEESDDEEMEESFHESLSDRLRAKLSKMKMNDDADEPIEESLSDTLKDRLAELEDDDEDQLEEDHNENDFDDETIDLDDLEEFNESTYNKICESYLRRVYENVDTFKCTSVKNENNKLIVEGVIGFTSGNTKTTSFEFSKPTVTKRGKVVLEGLNKTFTNTQNAYVLKGSVKNKEFFSESMIYRYTAKTMNESNQPESIKFYGRVVYKK